jgi:HK97 family phage major capsid protein
MSLLGYPIVIDEYMADLGSNTHPVFFGDLSRGYEIVSNFDTRITVDEISTKGYVSYYVRSYLGGCVTAGEAVKAIKCATS